MTRLTDFIDELCRAPQVAASGVDPDDLRQDALTDLLARDQDWPDEVRQWVHAVFATCLRRHAKRVQRERRRSGPALDSSGTPQITTERRPLKTPYLGTSTKGSPLFPDRDAGQSLVDLYDSLEHVARDQFDREAIAALRGTHANCADFAEFARTQTYCSRSQAYRRRRALCARLERHLTST
jgi:hypothetical protein